MLPLRHSPSLERRLNRHASTVLLGGLLVTMCGVLFLALCSTPCDDTTYGLHGDDSLLMSRSKAFWARHPLAPSRELKTFLMIMVMSGPANQHQRTTIRQTWLSDSPPPDRALVKFVVGTHNLSGDVRDSLDREQFLHNDLLLLATLTESYNNLTAKLLHTLQWADFTVDYKFLLKADDDSYVRVNLILKELQLKPSERLYWGFFNGRAHVKKSGKWAEKDWFLCDRYLPYALGGGYVLSSDLVHYVSTNSRYLQQYHSEDVSLGAWLAPLKIERIHDERFDTEFVSRGCRNDYLITHKQDARAMQQLHENLHKFRELCMTEFTRRESYKYDWNALPSKCCVRSDKILQ
ncbi:beta-1,3-galactosyltransferase 6-like [Babylonia areolata]|uniref:beta-1,3-galactosyltransferase 6-like n=1 Tax=Babylonia areolata TaxID=304850 RepID=UPI003FD39968